MNAFDTSLSVPYPASSLAIAIRSAAPEQRPLLLALYALHKKWREASVFEDPHHAVTTLNWWHQELENGLHGRVTHPDLLTLKPLLQQKPFHAALQALLHGHMHWHHLTRIETSEQLEPIVDAVGGSFTNVWLMLLGFPSQTKLAQSAGRALWWIDQIRHIGHQLAPARLWLPMSLLKELNLPANVILNRKLPLEQRVIQGKKLFMQLEVIARSALEAYQDVYKSLPKSSQKTATSLHLLMRQRALLLSEMTQNPEDIWQGLVTVSPRRKWWLKFWSRL